MALLKLLAVGLILKLTQSTQVYELESKDLEHDHNVTGILGENVYLRCVYTGQSEIMFSSWNRRDSSSKAKKLAGYYSDKPFSKDNFSKPASLTNLTVSMNVTSQEAEGQYTCVFNSIEEEFKASVFLTVLVQPRVQSDVSEEIVNGTQYQSGSCSTSGGKPMPSITWEIRGARPTAEVFTVDNTSIIHQDGRSDVKSMLRFPIHLNDADTVTCVIQHPAFPEPKRLNVKVSTFVVPDMTLETTLIQEEGKAFQEVTCRAIGGTPHPSITWVLPGSEHTHRMKQNNVEKDAAVSSYWLPLEPCEGKNVTCIFGYPKRPKTKMKTIALPRYYLSSLQLDNQSLTISNESQDSLLLEEGDINITIKLKVTGNVPHFKINCSKEGQEGQTLPAGVVTAENNIWIKGPVKLDHAGRYKCQASFYHHNTSLQLDIQVLPSTKISAFSPPNISMNVMAEADNITIECLASDAAPAANVSWVLPQELGGETWSHITFNNRTHSVKSILVLPACFSREHRVECVVEHPLLEDSDSRQISLPVCAPPNVTVNSTILWKGGIAYVVAECTVESVKPAATVEWRPEVCGTDNGADTVERVWTQPSPQHGETVVVQSTVQLPIYLFSGCNVTFVIEHRGMVRSLTKWIPVQSVDSSGTRVSVLEHGDSPLWLAVCEYCGDGVRAKLSWLLLDDAVNKTTQHSRTDGIKIQITSTYKFELSKHEGKILTCLILKENGENEKKTVQVPQYVISSVAVLNKTTLLRGKHRGDPGVHRVSLDQNLHRQKILLKVHGNVPSYKIDCYRNDGTAAHTEGDALVFAEVVSEEVYGLYRCQASYYHHKATVFIRVEVISEEAQHMTFVIICLSSATAITLILVITLCIFCRKNGGRQKSSEEKRKNRESLAALMQDTRSPEMRKMVLNGEKGQVYAELVKYSIVIDVKSTV